MGAVSWCRLTYAAVRESGSRGLLQPFLVSGVPSVPLHGRKEERVEAGEDGMINEQ